MINIKAQQTLVKFNKQDAGTLRYVMRPEKYSQLAENKVIAEAAVRSGIAKGALKGAWDAIGEVIKAWVTEGHSVAIPGLGTLRFGMNAQAVEDVNDVAKGLIRTRKVVFTPSVDIKSELKATKIAITCYDKDGNLVKRVTSTDDGEPTTAKSRTTTAVTTTEATTAAVPMVAVRMVAARTRRKRA